MRNLVTHASMALLALLAGGCGDSGGPSGATQLSFNLATASAPAPAGATTAAAGVQETFTDGTNTLVLTKVELALREIELHRAGVAECGGASDDDCEELELGPVLVDLPLGTLGAARHVSVASAQGTYDKVEFKIRAPSNGAGSVRVTGTYDGKDFVYAGNLDAELELELSPPLVASEAATDLTLFVDLSTWFRDQSEALIDPATANPGQPNEEAVKLRIKQSLHAFEDDDRNGRDDHGRGGGQDDGPNHQ
jgi:hypothetical protein